MKRRRIYPYQPYLKTYARKLRNKSTLAEILLWNQLKGKKMRGYDFHRQKPMLDYIVDFFCHELELAIEIDGSSHHSEEAIEKDKKRQKEIEALGISFLRFADCDIRHNMMYVLRDIEDWIENRERMMSGRFND